MKKTFIYALLLTLIIQSLFLSVWTMEAYAAASGGGSGTADDPYIILTAGDLSSIRSDLAAHYKLGADINLAGYDHNSDGGGWLPIGTGGAPFTGTLDGNGYEIRNLTINRPGTGDVGLFGYTGSSAEIRNICLTNINVTGAAVVGGLVGVNYGTVENANTTGSVTGSLYTGGLMGYNHSGGNILNSYSAATVNGTCRSGGLAGMNYDASIINSYATGNVTALDPDGRVGGLVGYNYDGGVIRNSYATGSVTGYRSVGGLVGYNLAGLPENPAPIIDNSYATGSVTGTMDIGGLVGTNSWGTVTNSYWDTETSGLAASAAGTGKTTAEMKSAATYSGYDFTNTWGIREGETYPYLLVLRLNVNALPVTIYNLSAGEDALSVTGAVYDNSIGELVTIHYDIKDNSGSIISSASVTSSVYADGSAQAIDRTIPLSGLDNGSYTLNISADDTSNPTAFATPLSFTVESTPPLAATYTVTFKDWNGTVLKTETVNEGSGATAPANPTRKGYIFTGWDKSFNNVTSDLTVTAKYRRKSSNSGGSSGGGTSMPKAVPEPVLITGQPGGVRLVIDTSNMEKITLPDGTTAEKVIFDEKTQKDALALLLKAENPVLTIRVNDTARTVQAQLPASWLDSALKSAPNSVIDIKLNGSSFRLSVNVLDLEGLAARLDAKLEDMKVNIIIQLVEGQTKDKLGQIAASYGGKLVGNAVDYKITVEGNGQSVEVRDFGGTYMARAIVLKEDDGDKLLTAVLYDPVTGNLSFVPSVYGTREDGTKEMVMNVPHNSIYAILAADGKTFADLSGHWAKADVELMASKLIIQGIGNDRFAPDAGITRAEFTALLVRALGLSVNQNVAGARFKDVAAKAWYAPAVESAVAAGLVSGITQDRFEPDERITREQMAVLIDRAISTAGVKAGVADVQSVLASFKDRDSISSWANAQAAQVVAAGIISGTTSDTFAPSEFATRAQAAVMLKRFLKYIRFMD